MKFAHQLKEALRRDGFPPHWVESAIPYGLLKKCIKKVEAELTGFGLDAETMRRLVPPSSRSDIQDTHCESGDAPVAFQYQFGEDSTIFRPTLTLYIQLEDGVAIDASLSHATMNYLASLADKQRNLVQLLPALEEQRGGDLSKNASPILHFEPARFHHLRDNFRGEVERETDVLFSIPRSHDGLSPYPIMKKGTPMIQQIEVPLTFDAEFFEILQGDLTMLDTLHTEEQTAMIKAVRTLGKEVAQVTNPSNHGRNDLGRWRELFDIYLQAGIFFSTAESDHGTRNSTVALKQLQWFQSEVMKRGLFKSFKVPASQEAFIAFTSLNFTLLHNLKFQEINQLAISKILKKFDKHTSLGAKDTFPTLIQSDSIMSETMAKAICSEVSKEIIKIVPQLDDYLCPVCFSISYKPVRLTCGHVFCIRCMIRMQRAQDRFCPLCRNNVIMHADSANIDASLMRFLQRYFPMETKAKQKENEIAVGVDLYGESYVDAKCIIM